MSGRLPGQARVIREHGERRISGTEAGAKVVLECTKMEHMPLPEGGQMGQPSRRFRALSSTTPMLSSGEDVARRESGSTDKESQSCLMTWKVSQAHRS